MAEQVIRVEDVEELKKLANGVTGSAEDLRSLESIAELVDYMKKDLKKLISSYWILVYDEGPDDGFTRIYRPIPCLPKNEAEEIVHRILGEEYYDQWSLKPVEIGEYERFMVLKKLTALKYHIRGVNGYGYEEYRLDDDVFEDVDSKVKALRAELGLTRRWEVVE